MDKDKEKKDYTPDIIFIITGLVLLSIIIARLKEYWAFWDLNNLSFWHALKSFFVFHIWPLLKIFWIILGVGAIVGMIDAQRKLTKINREERVIFGLANPPLSLAENYSEEGNPKWGHIQVLMKTTNPSDWRLAILEADIMLDEFLRASGYHGETIGEMLKSVEKSDFLTIESAWEAHKVRNRVAHDGSDYLLNEREAKQAIAHFESVFKEFDII